MRDASICGAVASSLLVLMSEAGALAVNGELSGLVRTVDDGSASPLVSVGIRYVPAYYGQTSSFPVDLQISGNVWASYDMDSEDPVAEASAYRLWIRHATDRFETRLGLQKISFGPAKLLRSLLWFDRLDPQDPLQLAQGVYALRLWYVFGNNANIWLWGLYGNKGTKGVEFNPTEEKSPEYGGRFQHPVGNGEIAITAHTRVIELSGQRVSERRIALDGVWDVGMGLLFESAFIRTDLEESGSGWQSFLTVGADYTLGIGNGLTVLGEHLRFTLDDSPFGSAVERNMSGVMMTYPAGLLDQLSYFGFYDWNDGVPYHYLSWQRNYDVWTVHMSAFWSSGTISFLQENRSLQGVGGKGLQVILIFNH